MTRLNVYAGPVGFYLLRGGSSDAMPGVLPGPGPAQGDPPGMKYYEIPIAIQDKTFSIDGSRFVYPDNRAYFEALLASQLKIPFIPSPATGGISDVSPLWNPEFFANTMVVNGKTWPTMTVEPRRYRFRFLNGCDSRFLILKLYSGAPPETLIDPMTGAGLPATPTHSFWQIGSDGGFLPAPVQLNELLMGPAERADVIVDFTGLPVGSVIYVVNDGADEPFGGGVPGTDFPVADRAGRGQVMKFVVGPLNSVDTSVDPASGLLALPARTPLGAPTNTRQVSLNENESETVYVPVNAAGDFILDGSGNLVNCDPNTFVPSAEGGACVRFGPTSAMLGTVDFKPYGAGGIMPMGMGMMWMDGITENPALNSTEVWEIYNFTMDAHPIHIHQVQFELVDRQPFMDMDTGAYLPNQPVRALEVWETGTKDTVIAYPGEITRVKANYDIPGLFVWHCHILSHEDNEMMRPFRVGAVAEEVGAEAHRHSLRLRLRIFQAPGSELSATACLPTAAAIMSPSTRTGVRR